MFSITFATTMQSTFGDYVCLCPRRADGSAMTDWFSPTASCANCQTDLDRTELAYEAYREEQLEAQSCRDTADPVDYTDADGCIVAQPPSASEIMTAYADEIDERIAWFGQGEILLHVPRYDDRDGICGWSASRVAATVLGHTELEAWGLYSDCIVGNSEGAIGLWVNEALAELREQRTVADLVFDDDLPF